MNLLVIDWDYFFPTPELGHADTQTALSFDWGHRESPFFVNDVWTLRAAEFLARDLPLPQVNVAWRTFWDRLRIAEDATLYYADSNVHALDQRIMAGVDELWLFDAHHDCGYDRTIDRRLLVRRQATFTCENWMLAYARLGVDLHVRYPAWRSYALKVEPRPLIAVDRRVDTGAITPSGFTTLTGWPMLARFDRIYVCRSGAWVPPWADEAFDSFLQLAPTGQPQRLTDAQWDRVFDQAAAERLADQMRWLRDQAMGGRYAATDDR